MQFNHSVSILQGNDETEYKVWPKPTEPWQKAFLKASKAKNSRSVIFMKCHVDKMGDYLNLWPLIIEKNVLEPSSTPEIYIYAGVNADDRYVYNKLSDKGEKESKHYDDLEKLAVSAKLDNFKTLLKS